MRLPVWPRRAAWATLVQEMALTVLIVDDHPGFRASARRLLEADGFHVIGEAGDGRSGVEAARALRPQVVLLDVKLPDLDGFAVAERITGEAGAPAVVLTSSHDDGDFGALVRRCGARGFVPKAELSGAALSALVAAP